MIIKKNTIIYKNTVAYMEKKKKKLNENIVVYKF